MKRLYVFLVAITLVIATDAFSKRGSGGFSSSRSSSSSSSRSYSKPAAKTIPAAKANVKKSKSTKSTLKKSTNTTKPKAVAKTKMDKKLNKKMASTDKAAAQKYGTKKSAETAYKTKLLESNKYTSPTAPATRPSHIPQHISVGGNRYASTYGVLPGGGYGYGYYDPTGIFIAMTAHHMMVDAHQMRMAGYGNWDANGRPIVYRDSGMTIVWTIVGLLLVVVIVGAIWKVSTD